MEKSKVAIVSFKTHLSNIKEYLAALKEETSSLQKTL